MNARSLEECVDGVTMREYRLDGPASRGLMEHLAKDGKLEVFDFAKAFFRYTRPGELVLKAFDGSDKLTVTYSRFDSVLERELFRRIADFDSSGEQWRDP